MLHSIVGWDCVVGAWSRVEGYPNDPNPNDPLARVSSDSLFDKEGRLNPSISILGMYYKVITCTLHSMLLCMHAVNEDC